MRAEVAERYIDGSPNAAAVDRGELSNEARRLYKKNGFDSKISRVFKSGVVGGVVGEMSPEAEFLLRQSILVNLVESIPNSDSFKKQVARAELLDYSKKRLAYAKEIFSKNEPVDREFMDRGEEYLDEYSDSIQSFALAISTGISG